jgi:uncharacterized protein (TIGR02246 family)
MILALFVALALQAGGDHASDVAAISAIEQRLASAWVTGDRAFIESVLADDWSVTDASGQVLTKRQVIDETFRDGDRRVDSMTVDEVRVRVYGDTAVVTGRTRAAGQYEGRTVTVTLRFTDVCVRTAGRWQIVASHASTVQ